METIDQNTNINADDLLVTIWTKPKQTIEFILKKCPDKYVTVLLVLGGIVRAIDRATMNNLGDNMPIIGVLTLAIIGGGLSSRCWCFSSTNNESLAAFCPWLASRQPFCHFGPIRGISCSNGHDRIA